MSTLWIIAITALHCLGLLLGFGLGLWYSKASANVLKGAAQFVMGGGIVSVYLLLLFVKLFGVTGTEPPTLLGVMVILVVSFLFPKNFIRIGKSGFEIGDGPGKSSLDGPSSSPPESPESSSSSSERQPGFYETDKKR